MRNILLLMISLVLVFTRTSASKQDSIYYPKIGELIKDHTFTDLTGFNGKSLRILDLKGKWTVLDFWGRNCISCIASFPKMNHLNEIFKDKVKLLMVGVYRDIMSSSGSEKQLIKNMYRMQKEKNNLTMSFAFDSLAIDKFDIGAVPMILVINPEGIIVAKTISIDSLFLEGLISGKKNISYKPAYSRHEKRSYSGFNNELPLLTNGTESNGGKDTAFLTRSLITKWNNTMPVVKVGFREYNLDFSKRPFKAELFNLNLTRLVRVAYTNVDSLLMSDPLYLQISNDLVFETSDTVKFKRDDLYAYSFMSHGAVISSAKLRSILLADLERYFDFKSSMETRKIKALAIVIKDSVIVQRLKTKGGISIRNYIDQSQTHKGMFFNNFQISQLIHLLGYPMYVHYKKQYKKLKIEKLPIVDRTNLPYNIDITIKANLEEDFEGIVKELNRNGFDLVPAEVNMKCIVIRDAEPVKPLIN